MDISAFISDLLARQGVLVVPGLGTFSRSRVDGHYNKEQQQFYPPTQQIAYKSDYNNDDDVLAAHIADERQISIASARYFIEKYVNSLLEQAITGPVQLGHMGTLSMRRGALVFTPGELNETDELFYGLAPVKLKRNSAFKQPAIVIPPPEPIVTEPPVIEQPVIAKVPEPVEVPAEVETTATYQQQEEGAEEEITEHKINIWLVLALIIVLIGVGIIGTYIYKPALFNNFKPVSGKLNTVPPVVKRRDTDSLKKASNIAPAVTKPDSVAPVDTFGIVAGQFKTSRMAKIEAERYVKKGFNAGVHRNPDNKHYDVNLGIYTNNDSAKNALTIAKQKLNTQDISIHTYPFKKQ